MKADRFFTIVQRVNSIFLLVIGLFALYFLVANMWTFVWRTGWPSLGSQDGRSAAEAKATPGFLGAFERLEGTDVVWAPLKFAESPPASLSSGGSEATRNFLFYDLATGKASWLIDQRNALFEWHRAATVGESGSATERVRALLFQVALKDTSGDGRVTEGDEQELAIAASDGTGFTVLLGNVQSIGDYYSYGDDRGFVFYVSSGTPRVAEIDLENRRLVSDGSLPTAAGELVERGLRSESPE